MGPWKLSQIEQRNSHDLARFQEMAAILGSLSNCTVLFGHFECGTDWSSGKIPDPKPPEDVGELR
jgi:hypothetical protein